MTIYEPEDIADIIFQNPRRITEIPGMTLREIDSDTRQELANVFGDEVSSVAFQEGNMYSALLDLKRLNFNYIQMRDFYAALYDICCDVFDGATEHIKSSDGVKGAATINTHTDPDASMPLGASFMIESIGPTIERINFLANPAVRERIYSLYCARLEKMSVENTSLFTVEDDEDLEHGSSPGRRFGPLR